MRPCKSVVRTIVLRVAAAGALTTTLAFILAPSPAAAQSYPNRPVRMVVPLPPGGANDLLARLFTERLGAALGQPIIVENRPGAGGNVGTAYVANQPGDGHTLLISSSTHVVNQSFFAKLPYDPIRDFEPVTQAVTVPFVMVVNAAVAATDLNQLLALARAKPGTVTYGTAGIGTPHHLAAEMLRTLAGVDIVHVLYKGAGGLMPALISGEVTFSIAGAAPVLPHIRSNKLRALATAGATRTKVLPEVPTIAEAGPLPGYQIDVWLGVLAPRGTPRAIVDRLNAEIVKIIRDPQIEQERLLPVGMESVGSTPERLLEVMKADLVKYADIARSANIRPE